MKNFWKTLGVTALVVGLCPYRVTLDKSTGDKKIRALLWKATYSSRSGGRGLSLDFGFFPPNEEEEAHLFADELAVDIQVIDSKSCRHPFHTFHLGFVGQCGYKPVGTVSRTRTIVHSTRHNRCIDYGNPFRIFPRFTIEPVDQCPHVFLVGSTASRKHRECCTIKHLFVVHHILFCFYEILSYDPCNR